MKKRDPKTGKFLRTKPDYKAMWEAKCVEFDSILGQLHDRDYRVEFLLDHCGPICRMRYNRHFAK